MCCYETLSLKIDFFLIMGNVLWWYCELHLRFNSSFCYSSCVYPKKHTFSLTYWAHIRSEHSGSRMLQHVDKRSQRLNHQPYNFSGKPTPPPELQPPSISAVLFCLSSMKKAPNHSIIHLSFVFLHSSNITTHSPSLPFHWLYLLQCVASEEITFHTGSTQHLSVEEWEWVSFCVCVGTRACMLVVDRMKSTLIHKC